MKYQIILESTTEKTASLPDDEFRHLVEQCRLKGFKILEARSLEGVREQLWTNDAEELL